VRSFRNTPKGGGRSLNDSAGDLQTVIYYYDVILVVVDSYIQRKERPVESPHAKKKRGKGE